MRHLLGQSESRERSNTCDEIDAFARGDCQCVEADGAVQRRCRSDRGAEKREKRVTSVLEAGPNVRAALSFSARFTQTFNWFYTPRAAVRAKVRTKVRVAKVSGGWALQEETDSWRSETSACGHAGACERLFPHEFAAISMRDSDSETLRA